MLLVHYRLNNRKISMTVGKNVEDILRFVHFIYFKSAINGP